MVTSRHVTSDASVTTLPLECEPPTALHVAYATTVLVDTVLVKGLESHETVVCLCAFKSAMAVAGGGLHALELNLQGMHLPSYVEGPLVGLMIASQLYSQPPVVD